MKKIMIAVLLITANFSLMCNASEIIQLPHSASQQQYELPEKEYFSEIWQTKVVTNVSQPVLEVFRPPIGTETGTAVIVAPGGGLFAHSIESEGRDAARWLAQKGITSFVLKYRLVPTTSEAVAELNSEAQNTPQQLMSRVRRTLPYSIEDGLNAIKHVRQHAEQYGIKADRIGFMGFSAGGSVALGVSNQYDTISKPNFIVPVYPWTDVIQLSPPKHDAPPMIIICASDDSAGFVQGALTLYQTYSKSGHNPAIHMYSKGGHGFGMKRQNLPSDLWIERVYEWLFAEKLI